MLLGLALCRARRILESGWRERSLAAGMDGSERAGWQCPSRSRMHRLAQTGMQVAAAVKESCVRNNGLASLMDGRCSGSKW